MQPSSARNATIVAFSMRIRRTSVVAVLFVASACVEAPPLESSRVRARAVAGCYALRVDLFAPAATGTWSPFDDVASFRLTVDSLSPQKPELYRVELPGDRTSSPDVREGGYTLHVWNVDETTDSVFITLSHESGGRGLWLRPRDDSLVGDALLFGDTGPPFVERVGRARAVRIACVGLRDPKHRGGAG